MPSLIDLRRRIRAVKSTQQITKAMKMIAASRLRRSQERILNARPFANEALRVLRDVAARTDASAHPLLAVREEKTALVFVLTADKGLCGSFNTNIIKAQDIITELLLSLNVSEGGEISKSLMSLYLYFKKRLLEANVRERPRDPALAAS